MFLSCRAEPPQNTQSTATAERESIAQHDFSRIASFAATTKSMFTSATPVRPGFTRVVVTLKVSGIAHLIGSGPSQRLLVIPNETGKGHQLMLAATPNYISSQAASLLTSGPTVQKGTGYTYDYRELPPGFEIDLPPVVESSLLFSDEGDATNDECPFPDSGTPDESLHWLPHLSKASGVTASVKPAFVQVDPSSANVSARLDITKGLLTSELSPLVHSFTFSSGGTPKLKQAVATYLVYTFSVDVSASAPVFTLRGHDFSANHVPVVLGNFIPDLGNIEIILANVPIADFFNQTPAPLAHFALHYDAVNGASPPSVIMGSLCRHGLGGDVECGPTQIP
jgi:hypothetical protein